MRGIDFIAVDFETANNRYDSACAIGIACVSGGEVITTVYSLLRPDGDFSPQNIAIHGITGDDVKDAPTFEDIWPEISPFFGPVAVVAHNAIFDMSVLKRSMPEWCLTRVDFKYIDTVSLCRDLVPGGKDLENCAYHLGVPLENHHNAKDDATACAKIAIECIKRYEADNLGDLCFALPNVKIHNFSDLNAGESYGTYSSETNHKPKITKSPRVSEIKCTADCIDSTNPLCGKAIVFTGELSIERAEAMQIAVNAGAVVRSGVSKKTDYLVVGVQDKQLVGEDGLSGKEEKAYALNESGAAHIEIIDEATFLALARGKKEV